MIDLHIHALFGLDDGPADLAGSLAMLRVADSDGIAVIAASPHRFWGGREIRPEAIRERVAAVRDAAASEGIGVEVLPGCEIPLYEDGPRLAELLSAGRLLPIGGRGRHVLCEPPFGPLPLDLEHTLDTLLSHGFVPVIAHPERCAGFHEQPERLTGAVERGALAQLTGQSLTGQFGRRTRALSEEWLRAGLIHLIASDAHSAEWRPPQLAAAREAAAGLVGPARARQLVEDNPRAILEDRPLPEPAEATAPPRSGVLGRLFGG